MVSIPSHVTLVGRLWPTLGDHAEGFLTPGAIAIVLITALPALALTAVVLPQIGRHLLAGSSARAQALFVAASALSLAAALIVPALFA